MSTLASPAFMLGSSRSLGRWQACSEDTLLEVYIRSGSQDAFRQIVIRHGEMVIRTCLRTLGHVQDAEDAAQAGFLLLARHPERARGSLAGWLHKAARDTAINLLHSRNSRRRREQARGERGAGSKCPSRLREELDAALSRLP